MPTYPLVSIVVVNFKDKKFLKSCLDSISRVDYPNYEVIVVDCLTGRLKEFLEENTYSRNVKLVHFNYDVGPTESHNVGANVARGKYIAFLDNDVEVQPLWLKELVNVMENEKDIAAAQSKILLTKSRCRFDCAGGFIDRFGFSFQRGWLEVDKGQYDKITDIFYAKGAALIVSKETFRKIGGFDSSFFFYYDETDFCWRLLLSGYRVLYVPRSIVFHDVGMKERYSTMRTYHYTRNHIATLVKNYGLKNLTFTILLPYFYYLGVALVNIKRKRINVSLALVKALLWNIVRLKQTWRRRMEIQRVIRKNSDSCVEQYMIQQPLLFHSIKKFLRSKDMRIESIEA